MLRKIASVLALSCIFGYLVQAPSTAPSSPANSSNAAQAARDTAKTVRKDPATKTAAKATPTKTTPRPVTPTIATSSPQRSPGQSATSSSPLAPPPPSKSSPGRTVPTTNYPWHVDIVSTTFWVGEIFDPNAADGSQMYSTYDARWYQAFGGCDGVVTAKGCATEARTAANGYFPLHMSPKQNPFYLDLPYDDVNDPIGARNRANVIPWAHDPSYAAILADPNQSLMKNRWVELQRNGRTCYGQVQDAGPAVYHDAAYVFGTARPASKEFNGAGMDVSPALNGCLAFAELDGQNDRLQWRFVDAADVPAGPWRTIVTTSRTNN